MAKKKAVEVAEEIVETETAELPMSAHDKRVEESREVLKHATPAGMKLFEAPDGYIVVSEEGKDHAWYRHGNGGKGMWINPRR